MKVVAGLGNPGKAYEATAHNAGFLVVDEVVSRKACRWGRSWRLRSRVCRVQAGAEAWAFVKPQTYMNLSGEAVARALRYWKARPEDLLVVLDDADLEMGRLRVRLQGSSGGHRGLASVMERVGSSRFARLRVGVGRDETGVSLVERVLRPFTEGERSWMGRITQTAADAVECILTQGGEAAMSRFNGVRVEQRERNE